MSTKSILSTVGKTAFQFIAAAALPGSPLIGEAAKFVASKLGIEKIEPTPEAIEAAINNTPDAILKLSQCDHEFQEYMAKLGFDSAESMERLANEDRADARAREIAVKDRTPQILAYLDLAAFLAGLGLLWKVPVPAGVHDLVLIMLTTLANNLIQERNYFFGSSVGSKAHGEAVAKLAMGAEAAGNDK